MFLEPLSADVRPRRRARDFTKLLSPDCSDHAYPGARVCASQVGRCRDSWTAPHRESKFTARPVGIIVRPYSQIIEEILSRLPPPRRARPACRAPRRAPGASAPGAGEHCTTTLLHALYLAERGWGVLSTFNLSIATAVYAPMQCPGRTRSLRGGEAVGRRGLSHSPLQHRALPRGRGRATPTRRAIAAAGRASRPLLAGRDGHLPPREITPPKYPQQWNRPISK